MNRNTWCMVLAGICLMISTSCATGHGSVPMGNAVETIIATGGTPQSHGVNGTFGAALVATVTNNGGPVGGLVVTFTAPATGPSATFSDTASIMATATTDANGLATSPSITANGMAGDYSITATISGVPTSAALLSPIQRARRRRFEPRVELRNRRQSIPLSLARWLPQL